MQPKGSSTKKKQEQNLQRISSLMSQIDKLASKSGVLASMTGSDIPTMNIEITNKCLKTDSPEKGVLSEEPTLRSVKD